MKRGRGEAVGMSAKGPIASVGSKSKAARAQHVQKRLKASATSKLYEILSKDERAMDRDYVEELQARYGSVKWNWFVGQLNEDRLGYTCPMRHVDGQAAHATVVKRPGGDSPHTWNKAAIPLNLAGIAGAEVKVALNYIRDETLAAEFASIKLGHAEKSGKGVARRHGVFGTATEQLKQTGFMVLKDFVRKDTLDTLEEMSKEYLANVDSGMSSPLAPCLRSCYN